jgi:hypothetical protein
MMASFTPSVICLHALRYQQRKGCAPARRDQAALMIPDETPPHRAEADTASAELKAANDDGGMGTTTIDPRLLVIARAVGRQLAREKLGKQQAANDNRSEDEP